MSHDRVHKNREFATVYHSALWVTIGSKMASTVSGFEEIGFVASIFLGQV